MEGWGLLQRPDGTRENLRCVKHVATTFPSKVLTVSCPLQEEDRSNGPVETRMMATLSMGKGVILSHVSWCCFGVTLTVRRFRHGNGKFVMVMESEEVEDESAVITYEGEW